MITGGAGFIGSHLAVELLDKNYNVIIYDNLSNSSLESLNRVEKITEKKLKFYDGDLLDGGKLRKVLKDEKIDLVIHCAALKAIGESVKKPLEYYNNNLTGTLTLLSAMKNTNIKKIVFSSSATV